MDLSLSSSLTLATLSILGYALLCYFIFYHDPLEGEEQRFGFNKIMLLAFPVLIAHLLFLNAIIHQNNEVNLGLVNIVCLIGWLAAALTLLSSTSRPVIKLCLFAFPVAALSVLLCLIFPSHSQVLHALDSTTLIHIFLSIIAFSVLTIAAGQSIFIAILDYRLKHKLSQPNYLKLPPLQTLEASLFEIISLGVILLSCSILSGLFFLENMFAQHVVHKTILSIIAWFVFTTLLIGKASLGWRGSMAIKMALSGYALLFVAYLGSKFVLEIMLNRM